MAPPRLPKWHDPRLYVRDSPIDGRGLFTRAPIDPGEVVMRWGGLVVPRGEWTRERYDGYATTAYDERHYLTDTRDQPPTPDLALNHSCDPNIWLLDAVTVAARRPIAADEELVIDAATYLDDDDVHADPCLCGSPLCRRVILGTDWRLPAVQARLAGHFLPFLAARIAALR
jgi:SET domain-containing protein